MESDLAMLPAGDFPEIGLKGINLSGGQKAKQVLLELSTSSLTKTSS
jgi:hypothetical protein